MEPMNWWERFWFWVLTFRREGFCRHAQIETQFTAEVFHVDKWERCTGVGYCLQCGADVLVTVPANRSEQAAA